MSLFDFSGLDRQNGVLEHAPTEEILRWAWDAVGPCLAMGTAFGATGMVLLDLLHRTVPDLPVFTIDTGYLFEETLSLKARVESRYGIVIESVRPALSVEEQSALHGEALFARDPDRCCYMRKVEPLHRRLATLDGWMTSLRRDQGESRERIQVLEPFPTHGDRIVLKINPMARWTRKQVWDYILEHEVPYNPLMDRGYPSIGCWPCTQPVGAGAGERDGRWARTGKVECGLHVITPAPVAGRPE